MICGDEWHNSIYYVAPRDDQQKYTSFMKNYPSGTSTQNLKHYAQMVQSQMFQLYDYGNKTINLQKYNQDKPLVLNLTRIAQAKIDILMYDAEDDPITNTIDSNWTRDQIKLGHTQSMNEGMTITRLNEFPKYGAFTFFIGNRNADAINYIIKDIHDLNVLSQDEINFLMFG